ncbi:response regulator [Yoonia sp.]|nr:response regulator [Yoonia sp.]
MISQRILVVDDDPKVRLLLRRCLEEDGLAVLEAETEEDVVTALETHDIGLVTLDVQLENDNGFEIARRLRRNNQVPIIMVTGQDDVIDRVVGLEIGADDYITKPFHVREVQARVRAVLRRDRAGSQPAQTNDAHSADNITIHSFDGMVARFDQFELLDRTGEVVNLTIGEFRLLNVFLQNPKHVLSRDHLMDLLNGTDWSPLDRTIDNQIARLRRKIERKPNAPMLIRAVRGIGYIFTADVETS